jgi:hypothetical protein
MRDLPLRPRSVTELVDAAFTLYRRDSLEYIVVAAVAMTPALVLQLILPPALTPQEVSGTGLLASQISTWFGLTLISAIVTRFGSDVYLGGDPDMATVIREVAPRAPRALVASALKLPLYVLGFAALLVGALYVTARYFAVATVVVLEGKGPLAAFKRSSQLSKGRKRHILNTLALVMIIYLIVTMGVVATGSMLGSRVLTSILGTMFTVITYPVVALSGMVLYYDARIRGEGFDMEQMAEALDAPLASPAGA